MIMIIIHTEIFIGCQSPK